MPLFSRAVLCCIVLSVFPCGAAAPTPQQSITGFSPVSGVPGTVVTLTGTGFTGSSVAWVGDAHNASLKVLSDRQAQLVVPAGASTGKIAVLNSLHAAFSWKPFTLAASSPAYPQPVIHSFSPVTGPAGTVVSVAGSGFTGASAGWIGNARDGKLKIVSDGLVQLTVPADASSGQLALMNPGHAAFSPSAFTVSHVVVGSGSSSGGGSSSGSSSGSGTTNSSGGAASSSGGNTASAASAAHALRVQGAHFVNASGAVVQLRGVNYSGFEFVAIQGWDPSDPSGAQAGQIGGPKWSAIAAWKANTVRIPLNEASWLGYSCTDSSGVVHNPDPGGNYKSAVQTQVNQATSAGLYVIIDLHWTAPGNACPMLQTQMADSDHSIAFWTSVATTFKSYPNVLFELFNEPFLNFDFTGNAWSYMMKGTGGAFSGYPATSNSGNWQDVKKPWVIASYQAMLNAVRATGATNVVLVGTMQYSQDFSGWLLYRPTDPLKQMAAAWHPYPTYGTAWGSAAYAQPNFAPLIFTEVQLIQAAGYPVIATETGDRNSAGTVGAPLVSTVTAWADTNGVSVIGWAWDSWSDADNVLIKDAAGTPTDGYGAVFKKWLLAH